MKLSLVTEKLMAATLKQIEPLNGFTLDIKEFPRLKGADTGADMDIKLVAPNDAGHYYTTLQANPGLTPQIVFFNLCQYAIAREKEEPLAKQSLASVLCPACGQPEPSGL